MCRARALPKAKKPAHIKRPSGFKYFVQRPFWGYLNERRPNHSCENPLACKECENQFSTLTTLKHYESKHTHACEYPFKCEYCEKSFTQKVIHVLGE